MSSCADLVLVLSTIAAAVALWFRFSSDRAAKRALALIRRDAPQREPGLALEIVSATRDSVEVRIVNRADAWNLIATLSLAVDARHFAATQNSLTLPLVIQANDTATARLTFKGPADRVVLVDIDDRRVEALITSSPSPLPPPASTA
ncbi:MAG TPA: hypothetical protein VF215_09920 [Thermoanaerobaculia bacterium]